MLKNAVDANFMRKEHQAIWQVATTAEEALQLLYTSTWNCEVRKYGII
jgi:hypothetical protein